MTSHTVVRFPAERVARSAAIGATWLDIMKSRVREHIGRTMCRVGIPGAIQGVSLKDSRTGQEISISVGAQYVCLSVNGRDYYFDRITGRFDGTGSAL